MKSRRVLTTGVAALLCAMLAACAARVLSGPPEIHYGKDVCAHCGMILSDDRFAAAIAGGEREPALFDHVGCMLKYEAEHPLAVGQTRYFRDAAARAWLTEPGAAFIQSPDLETPMSSGIAASAAGPAAEALAREHKTDPRSYADLMALRSARAAR